MDDLMNEKKAEKKKQKKMDKLLIEELEIDKAKLNKLKKKLAKVAPRAERGAETLFRLVSRNHNTLNVMIDRKSSILISINAVILSIIIGTLLDQLDIDPYLIFPVAAMLLTNMISMTFAVMAARPEMFRSGDDGQNVMFYGNFTNLGEEEYVNEITGLIYKGDELYRAIAKDTYYLGKSINKRFRMLRNSFNVFLFGIILSVIGFIIGNTFFG